MKRFKLSRRDFLKVTGAMGIVTALGGIQALNTSCFNKEVTKTITPTNETTTFTNVPTTGTSIPTVTTDPNKEIVILISSAYADPGVTNGRKFEWVNIDNKTHTVTCDEYEPNFEFVIKPGESAHFDLTDYPGVYYYWCREHINETAELIVT
jgi:plastocyanin